MDQDSLFVAFDGIDKQFFVALDKRTGETRWKKDRNVNSDWEATLRAAGSDPSGIMASKPGDNKKSFATAHLIEHEGRRQVVAPGGEAIMSYDPKTGEEFWRVYYLGHYNVAARPLFKGGLLYVYVTGPSERMLAIRPDGTGDVTDSHVVWSTRKGIPNIPSPVIIGDEIVVVSENGVARCLDSKTGDEYWKRRVGGNYWASPLLFMPQCLNGVQTGRLTSWVQAGKKSDANRNEHRQRDRPRSDTRLQSLHDRRQRVGRQSRQ